MRHTLLPLQERIALRKEYRTRAIIVFLFMISSAFFIGIISMFPSFIKASSEEDLVTKELSSLKINKDRGASNSIETDIALSKKLLSSFGTETFQPKASLVISNIVGLRDSLKITSISINNISTSTVTTVIQGIAPTRNSLISFKTRFETATLGNKVEIPVSQLGKSSNLQFSLQLLQQL